MPPLRCRSHDRDSNPAPWLEAESGPISAMTALMSQSIKNTCEMALIRKGPASLTGLERLKIAHGPYRTPLTLKIHTNLLPYDRKLFPHHVIYPLPKPHNLHIVVSPETQKLA